MLAITTELAGVVVFPENVTAELALIDSVSNKMFWIGAVVNTPVGEVSRLISSIS